MPALVPMERAAQSEPVYHRQLHQHRPSSPRGSPRRLDFDEEQNKSNGPSSVVLLGFLVCVLGLVALVLMGSPSSSASSSLSSQSSPNVAAEFAAALERQAVAFACEGAASAFVALPAGLEAGQVPGGAVLAADGLAARLAGEPALPLLCRWRRWGRAALAWLVRGLVGLAGLLAVLAGLGMAGRALLGRRARAREDAEFAGRLAAFVEELLAHEARPRFADELRREALAPQQLEASRLKELWEQTERLLETNPRLQKSQMTREGELCTAWSIA